MLFSFSITIGNCWSECKRVLYVRKKENAILAKPTDTWFHYCHLRLKPSLNSATGDRRICRVKAKLHTKKRRDGKDTAKQTVIHTTYPLQSSRKSCSFNIVYT